MKLLRRLALVVASSTVLALVLPLGTSAAQPTAAPYLTGAVARDGTNIIASLRDGTFDIDHSSGVLRIVSAQGRVLDSMPLTGEIDGYVVPLRPTLSSDRTRVTLTPSVDAGLRSELDRAAIRAEKREKAKPKAKRITKAQRYDMMWKELHKGWKGNTPLYTLIGGLIGFLVFAVPGAAIGAAIGAYIGYQTSNPKAWPSVVAWWNTP